MHAVFHPDARQEYIEAIAFYKQIDPDLGARFADEVESAIASILNTPARWPRFEMNVHRYLLGTFSYGLF